jgi:hypothetical protein
VTECGAYDVDLPGSSSSTKDNKQPSPSQVCNATPSDKEKMPVNLDHYPSMESSGLRGLTRRPLPENLVRHSQTAQDAAAVSSMMGIRQTLLSAVLFDIPDVCSPLVSELVADYHMVAYPPLRTSGISQI